MKTFLFQTGIQACIIGLLWAVVARDVTKLRDRHGTTPSNISPFAWGALCGLTWIALIPYLGRRNSVAGVNPPTRERNLLPWWLGLAAAAGIWSASNAVQGDSNNAAQHVILAGIFLICALIAWTRDRAVSVTP